MKRVALIYARLSKKTTEDISPQRQIELCTAAAKQRGWHVEAYEEDLGNRSGRSEKNRPVWKQVRAALATRDDIAALVCADIARVSRSIIDFFKLVDELRQREIELVSLKEQFDTTTASGRMMLGVICLLNQWYADDISERQKATYAHLRSAGAWVGKPPQGTQIAGRGTARHLTASDAHYTIAGKRRTYLTTVRAWLKLLSESSGRIGTYRGAVLLNEQGYRWKGNDGKPRKIVFGDLRKVNETLGNWRGILDDALLDDARAYVDTRKHRRANGPIAKYPILLLSGILYCAQCGARFSMHHAHGRSYYRHQRGDCPQEGYISADVLDAQALTLLRDLVPLSARDKHAIAQRAARGADAPPKRVDRRAALERKIKRLEEYAVDDIISRDTYTKKRAALLVELDALPVDDLRNHPPLSAAEYIAMLGDLERLIVDVARVDPALANQALRDAFESLHVRGRKIVRHVFQADLRAWHAARARGGRSTKRSTQ